MRALTGDALVNDTTTQSARDAAIARVLATHDIHQQVRSRRFDHRHATHALDDSLDTYERIQYLNNHDRDDRSW